MMYPKRKPIRSKKWREAARGQECTGRTPWCTGDPETVVCAHSNWQEDGKGEAYKADDLFSADLCSGCHRWLDEGAPGEAERRDYFHAAMKRTLRRRYDMGLLKVDGAK